MISAPVSARHSVTSGTQISSQIGSPSRTPRNSTGPGIGPGRKRALLMHFGTARAVKSAALEDLERVAGINKATARAVYDYFHPNG